MLALQNGIYSKIFSLLKGIFTFVIEGKYNKNRNSDNPADKFIGFSV